MKKQILLLGTALLVILTGCTTKLSEVTGVENRAPELVRVLTDLSVEINQSITLSLEYIEARDKDGDELSLIILDGSNYRVSNLTIIPDSGFVGDLAVKVQVSDGTLLSKNGTIIISVVKLKTLIPLEIGFWWEYEDYAVHTGKVDTSRLMITGASLITAGSSVVNAFRVEWTNLSDYGVVYFMGNDSTGSKLYGGMTSFDTLMTTQLYPYPVSLSDTWDYSELKYSASARQFFSEDTVTMSCSNTSKYVTVPAGVFHCVEYTTTYTNGATRAAHEGYEFHGRSPLMTTARADRIVEKLYYSEGIGYIKKEVYQNGVLTWKKELVSYNVVESL